MKKKNAKGRKTGKRPSKLIDILVKGYVYLDYIKYMHFCGVLGFSSEAERIGYMQEEIY